MSDEIQWCSEHGTTINSKCDVCQEVARRSLAVRTGSAKYRWKIELHPSRNGEPSLWPFQGTQEEASAHADKLSDEAPYPIRGVVLHRCGLLSSQNGADEARGCDNQ